MAMVNGSLPLERVPLILLAGGLGKRIRSVSGTGPKSLIEIEGQPFIEHQLSLFQQKGIRRVILCLGYLGGQIEKAVGDGSRYGLQVDYSWDGDQLLGTAGALKKAAPLLTDLFWVVNGDTYLDVDFKEILRVFQGSHALGLLTVFRNEGRFDRSNIVFQNGKIEEYDKWNLKPTMHHIDAGVQLFRKEALGPIPSDVPFELGNLYQMLLEMRQLEAFEVKERFYEIGSPEGLAETRQFLKRPEHRRQGNLRQKGKTV